MKRRKTQQQRDYRQFPEMPGDLFTIRPGQVIFISGRGYFAKELLLLLSNEDDYFSTVMIMSTGKIGQCDKHILKCKQSTKFVGNLSRGRLKRCKPPSSVVYCQQEETNGNDAQQGTAG